MTPIKLGLIGDNIRTSSAPTLHRMAAAQWGMDLSYDLIVPPDHGMDFTAALAFARDSGLRGVNVTLPYKEKAFRQVAVADPAVRQLGAVNTVCFDAAGLTGANTDFTGFLKSYRAARGDVPAGRVLLVGAGGVGRSIGFALSQLGASQLLICDKNQQAAENLSAEINQLGPNLAEAVTVTAPLPVDAVVNCTPAGMVGYGGLPLPAPLIPQRFDWAFDAVYQPVETPFKQLAESRGVAVISGFELFFHQGVDAFLIFTGKPVKDAPALRAALRDLVHKTG